MALAGWFEKHYNSDVTGVGKAPLRKRIWEYRQIRAKRKRGFLGAQRIQKKTFASATEQERAASPVRLMMVKQ